MEENDAIMCLKTEARNGNVDAMYDLGTYFHHDDENERYDKAIKYYKMAIKNGHVPAMHGLGYYYDTVENNYETALKYYMMGAENDDSSCMYNIALYYEKKLMDYAKAITYYDMALKHGDTDSIYRLAICYKKSDDYETAIKYYEDAATFGNVKAMLKLGRYYTLYSTTKEKIRKGIEFYEMAAKHGCTDSMMDLADFLLRSKKYTEALAYYKMALDCGHDEDIDYDVNECDDDENKSNSAHYMLNYVLRKCDDFDLLNDYADYLDLKNSRLLESLTAKYTDDL